MSHWHSLTSNNRHSSTIMILEICEAHPCLFALDKVTPCSNSPLSSVLPLVMMLPHRLQLHLLLSLILFAPRCVILQLQHIEEICSLLNDIACRMDMLFASDISGRCELHRMPLSAQTFSRIDLGHRSGMANHMPKPDAYAHDIQHLRICCCCKAPCYDC